VKDGALVPHGLRHEGLAPEEVETAIREHGIADVRGVRAAYLEPDGTISVIPIDVQPMRGRHRVKRVRQFRRGERLASTHAGRSDGQDRCSLGTTAETGAAARRARQAARALTR
jgi:Predicted membrane protein